MTWSTPAVELAHAGWSTPPLPAEKSRIRTNQIRSHAEGGASAKGQVAYVILGSERFCVAACENVPRFLIWIAGLKPDRSCPPRARPGFSIMQFCRISAFEGWQSNCPEIPDSW
jgi:hypothetical protein